MLFILSQFFKSSFQSTFLLSAPLLRIFTFLCKMFAKVFHYSIFNSGFFSHVYPLAEFSFLFIKYLFCRFNHKFCHTFPLPIHIFLFSLTRLLLLRTYTSFITLSLTGFSGLYTLYIWMKKYFLMYMRLKKKWFLWHVIISPKRRKFVFDLYSKLNMLVNQLANTKAF